MEYIIEQMCPKCEYVFYVSKDQYLQHVDLCLGLRRGKCDKILTRKHNLNRHNLTVVDDVEIISDDDDYEDAFDDFIHQLRIPIMYANYEYDPEDPDYAEE